MLTWGTRPLGFFAALAEVFGAEVLGAGAADVGALGFDAAAATTAGGAAGTAASVGTGAGAVEGANFFEGQTAAETLSSQSTGIPGVPGAPVQESSFNANGPLSTLGPPNTLAQILQGLVNGKGIGGFGASALGGSGIGSALSIGSSLYGLSEAEKLKKLSAGLGAQADPFGPYRQQYAQQLSALSANPSLITKQPGYQAGIEAVQRTMAAGGYTGSGNEMAALAKYGGDFYNQTADRYASLAGAQFNPAAGAQLNLTGNIAADQLEGNALNRGIFGTLLSGIGGK